MMQNYEFSDSFLALFRYNLVTNRIEVYLACTEHSLTCLLANFAIYSDMVNCFIVKIMFYLKSQIAHVKNTKFRNRKKKGAI